MSIVRMIVNIVTSELNKCCGSPLWKKVKDRAWFKNRQREHTHTMSLLFEFNFICMYCPSGVSQKKSVLSVHMIDTVSVVCWVYMSCMFILFKYLCIIFPVPAAVNVNVNVKAISPYLWTYLWWGSDSWTHTHAWTFMNVLHTVLVSLLIHTHCGRWPNTFYLGLSIRIHSLSFIEENNRTVSWHESGYTIHITIQGCNRLRYNILNIFLPPIICTIILHTHWFSCLFCQVITTNWMQLLVEQTCYATLEIRLVEAVQPCR